MRVSVKADGQFLEKRRPEATQLFQKVVTQRQGTEADRTRLTELWRQLSFEMLDIPDNELFSVKRLNIAVPAYSRIFASAKCSSCGENVMETRARMRDGKIVCIPCSGQEHYQLTGDGMSLNRSKD